MYQRHWNFRRPPFQNDTSSALYFPGRSCESALVKLRFLLDRTPAVGALMGASGSGKTYLVQRLERYWSGRGPFVSLVFPQLSGLDLVDYLLQRIGCEGGHPASLGQAVRLLEDRLTELTAQGQGVCFVVDDAHLIDQRQTWETLQQIVNLQLPGQRHCSLLLVGQPELLAPLQRAHQLADRLLLVAQLDALTASETAEYITHRVRGAGVDAVIFSEDALASVFRFSGGNPRRINRLCDFALLLAYAEDRQTVTEQEICSVADEVFGSRAA